MKKFLINLSLSLTVFVVCLGLVEVFFTLNAHYKWVAPRRLVPPSLPAAEIGAPLPPELVQNIVAHYKNYKPQTQAGIRHDLSSPVASNRRELSPAIPVTGIHLNYESQYSYVRNIHDRVRSGDQVIYDVHYEIDGKGRRRIPDQKISAMKPNLILIGCSLTFGIGAADRETMPFFLQRMNPEYNVYNMGIPGAGLNDLLDDMYAGRRLQDLNGNGGIVVYSFIYDHLERTFCSLDCFRKERKWWMLGKNNYTFTDAGELVNRGSYLETRPLSSGIYRLLARSEFLNFIGYDRPKIYGPDERGQFVRMLQVMRQYYNAQGYDFYVFPVRANHLTAESLSEELKSGGIKSVVYDVHALGPWIERGRIVGDGHFNELGNYIMASMIHQMLKEKPPELPAVLKESVSQSVKN